MKVNSLVGRILAGVLLVAACGLGAYAQGAHAPKPGEVDDAAIRASVKNMVDGWNTKSGELFAKPFAADADYVVINGMHLQGHDVIAQSHQRIFDTIYKDSTLSLSVKQIRYLRPDVAVVHVTGNNKTRRGAETMESNAIITLVMTKEQDAWKIVAFQNTQVVPARQN
ncbi:MAG TPA: SgcJ/EcaC family oxidoreductase [Pyrinomonadaceae bacterium]|nr:SgcJ/EcaC family oxidoreductase [Pyrinomonadaceae bacterium]